MGGINCPPPFKEGEREVSKELLVIATNRVQIAKMELMAMSVKGSLQQSLWRNSALTESFTKALLAINATTAWQSGFARTFASVGITA